MFRKLIDLIQKLRARQAKLASLAMIAVCLLAASQVQAGQCGPQEAPGATVQRDTRPLRSVAGKSFKAGRAAVKLVGKVAHVRPLKLFKRCR